MADIEIGQQVYWRDDEPWSVAAARDDAIAIERVVTRVERCIVSPTELRPNPPVRPFGLPSSTRDL